MVVLSPLFVAGDVGIALLHASASDPLREFAAPEPGEVVALGRVSSAPVPTTGSGYRADLRVEHLWYEEQEILRGGASRITRATCRSASATACGLAASSRAPR